MANHRTYTDDQLRMAVSEASCWSDVMERIGKRRGAQPEDVKKVVTRLGIDVSHFTYSRSGTPVQALPTTFSAPRNPGFQSGLVTACRWFLERGYAVSVPIEPTLYDLVTDSDEGLKRIQVKTTRRKTKGGRYSVALTRTVYRSESVPNPSGGKYRQVKYDDGMLDFFFIVTADGSTYLVPFAAVSHLVSLVLDEKYRAFLVP